MTKPILIILSNQQEPIFSQTYIKTTDKQTISSAVQNRQHFGGFHTTLNSTRV